MERSPIPSGAPRGRGGSAVLEVHHVTKRFRPRKRGAPSTLANDDLSLTVAEGEVVALLGPNGAGKSTFLRQVAGQLLPDAGSIRVAGRDMVADPRGAKEGLSVIPQECQPIPNLTVEEEVRGFGQVKGWPRSEARARCEELLERLGLAGQKKKLVRELSGGFKRRVLIAVALAGARRPLLLLDEPTTGLDPAARREVWTLVDRLRSEGLGILLTTHYIEEAEYLADRVVIVREGKFVRQGTVDEIRSELPFRGRIDIRDLLRAPPEGRARVEELAQRYRVAFRGERFVRFEVPDPFSPETVASLAELTRLGVAASLAPASLEDAYLRAVGAPPEGAA